MSYTINLSINSDDNDTLSVVEKTCWYYSGGADWKENEGRHVLSLRGSGTSGMLRFRTSTGESFCLAVGIHNYVRWCDIIVDAGDADTAVRIHPTYYVDSHPRNQMIWNQLSSLERTTRGGRTLAINFFRDDSQELFATLTSTISKTMDRYLPHSEGWNSDSEVQGQSDLPKSMRSQKRDYQKIFAILNAIGEPTHIEKFSRDDITDLWLPFSDEAMPKGLPPHSFARFQKTQETILPQDVNLESGGHCHLPENEVDRSGIPTKASWEGFLGGGGFGHVYKVNLGTRSYALKTIPRGKTFDKTAEVMRFFESEMRILKKIKERKRNHFVQLIASYTTSQWVGLVMSPVANFNLKEFLTRVETQKLAGERRLLWTFFGCLLSALADLHFHLQVRHKDIKPANILVYRGTVLLTDFGMALEWSDIGQTTTKQDNRMTDEYCSPEVARNDFRQSSSDIWSLGCVYLEMMTVLKKRTVEDMKAFFGAEGSKDRRFWNNQDAISSWITKLRDSEGSEGSEFQNAPLGWIETMLRQEAKQRPDARTLRDDILNAPSDPATSSVFCCGLCQRE